jgi:hypothetical protein
MSGSQVNVTAYDGNIGQQAETVEPAFTKLNAIKNGSGTALIAKPGVVALWLGTLATIPVGWVLCDGTNDTVDMRSRHLKIANTIDELSVTGGSNTHTHAAQSHSHAGSGSHNHTATGVGHVASAGHDGGGAGPPMYTVVHGQSVATSAPNYANASTTADSVNNEPPYKTVAYIQFKYGVATPNIISQFV